MAKKKLGRVCFIVTDFSDKNAREIGLIRKLVDLVQALTVVVNNESFTAAQTILPGRLKLINISMSEKKLGVSVAKKLFKLLHPNVILTFSTDKKAGSFARRAKLKTKTVVFGTEQRVVDDVIQVVDDESAAAFIVNYIEQWKRIDFYPKCYAHLKALRTQMSPSQVVNAALHRRVRIKKAFAYKWGYNLPDNPTTYNEKINYLKLHGNYRRYRCYADKQKVRGVLAKQGYSYLLPDCFAVVNCRIIKRLWNALPEKFVVKPSNSSGYNIVVEKSSSDLSAVNRVLRCIKRVKYGLLKNEPVYRFCGKFVLTQYLDDIIDYKFFCFDGKVRFVAVVREWLKENNNKEPYQIIVDRNYKELPFSFGYERGSVDYVKPVYFGDMVKDVEKLAKGISHVRIDMMGNNQRYYFGEFTFFSGSGNDRFHPEQYDEIVGQYLKI